MSASVEEYAYAYCLVKSYFFICTKGCGALPGKCSNEFCGSNTKWRPNDAAIQSLYLALEKPAPLCDTRFLTPKEKEEKKEKTGGVKEEDTLNRPEVEEEGEVLRVAEDGEEVDTLLPFLQSPPSTPRQRLIKAMALDSHLNTLFFRSERTNRSKLHTNTLFFSNPRYQDTPPHNSEQEEIE
jgi:hypothetical protein